MCERPANDPPRIDGALPGVLKHHQKLSFKIQYYLLYLSTLCSCFHYPPAPFATRSAMSRDESDSDKTEPFDEQERYLEQNEFMEHPDFGQDDSKSLHRNVTAVRAIRQRKLMSAAIRQRVREQSEAHLYITPAEKPVDTIKSNETNDQRLSYLAIIVASLITFCVLRFVLKEPCNCTYCTINI